MYFDYLPGDLIGGDNIFESLLFDDTVFEDKSIEKFFVIQFPSCDFLASVSRPAFTASLSYAVSFDTYDDAAAVIRALCLSDCHVFLDRGHLYGC